MSSLEVAALITDINNKYVFYSSIVILFIGIISNTLIIVIFTTMRMFRDNRSAYYLAIESMTDIGLLLAILPSNIVGYPLNKNPIELSRIWCKLELMSSYCFGFCSLYSICFLALDQYLSTNHRQHWRQKSTLQLAYRLTWLNRSIALFHGILFLIFAEIGSVGCIIYHPIVRIYFTFCFYPIIGGVLPVIISSWLSLLAYRNVRRLIRRQSMVRRRLDRQMTAIALARVICIITLGTPFIAASLVLLNTTYNNDDYIKKAIINLIVNITYSFLYTNFSINFYVFLIISPRFRHQVKQFLMKRCGHSLRKLCDHRLRISRNNQVVPAIVQRHLSILESA